MTTLSTDGLKNYRIIQTTLNNGSVYYSVQQRCIVSGLRVWSNMYSNIESLNTAKRLVEDRIGQEVRNTKVIELDTSP